MKTITVKVWKTSKSENFTVIKKPQESFKYKENKKETIFLSHCGLCRYWR